jgi:hypothetical protein
MTWAQRLKRVFNIDVEIFSRCGGAVKVIADMSDRCIEDQQIIDKILFHLKKKDGLPSHPDVLPETRAPPQTSLLGRHLNSLMILLAGTNRRQGIAKLTSVDRPFILSVLGSVA